MPVTVVCYSNTCAAVTLTWYFTDFLFEEVNLPQLVRRKTISTALRADRYRRGLLILSEKKRFHTFLKSEDMPIPQKVRAFDLVREFGKFGLQT